MDDNEVPLTVIAEFAARLMLVLEGKTFKRLRVRHVKTPVPSGIAEVMIPSRVSALQV
jgi:hypothetical protein